MTATVGLYVYDRFKIGPALAKAYLEAVNPSPCLFFTTPDAALGFIRQNDWAQAKEICNSKRQNLARHNHVEPHHIFFEHELPPKQKALQAILLYQWRLSQCRERTSHLWDHIKPRIGFVDALGDQDWHLLTDPPSTTYKVLNAFSEKRIQELVEQCQKDVHRVVCLEKNITLDALSGAAAIVDATTAADVHRCTAPLHRWIHTPLEYGLAQRWTVEDKDVGVIWNALQLYIQKHSQKTEAASEADLEGLRTLCTLYHALADFSHWAKWSIGLIFRRMPSEREHFYILDELSVK